MPRPRLVVHPGAGLARVVLALALGIAIAAPGGASAADIIVSTTMDELSTKVPDGFCSLREAVISANTNGLNPFPDCIDGDAGLDTILLPSGLYELTLDGPHEDDAWTGDLDATDDLEIYGEDVSDTEITTNWAGDPDRVLDGHSGVWLFLENLRVTNGQAPDGDDGGGIRSEEYLDLANCVVDGNRAGDGASDNSGSNGSAGGDGGGIYAEGCLHIADTEVTNNSSGHGGDGSGGGRGGHGGGIFHWSQSTCIVDYWRLVVQGNVTGDGGDGDGTHGGAGGSGGQGGGIRLNDGSPNQNCLFRELQILDNHTGDGGDGVSLGNHYGHGGDGGDGGGVWLTSSLDSTEFIGIEVVGNHTGDGGLADVNNGGQYWVSGGGGGNGGGICVNFSVQSFSLSGSDILSNWVGDGGGTYDAMGGCTSGCGAAGGQGGSGGGIFVEDVQGVVGLGSCDIDYNAAGSGGDGSSNSTGGPGGSGGGIALVGGGPVGFGDCSVSFNVAGNGGDVVNGTSSGDGGDGGGIEVDACFSMYVGHTRIDGNAAGSGGSGGASAGDGGDGGGIAVIVLDGLSVDSSSVTNNGAGDGGDADIGGFDGWGGDGGGVDNPLSWTTSVISNSTISGNHAGSGGTTNNNAQDGSGGGLSIDDLSMSFSTVTDNTGVDGGGWAGNYEVSRSIIAGNHNPADPSHADCSWSLSSQGQNVFGLNTGCGALVDDETIDPGLVFTDLLDTLAENGGPTPTHALRPGSVAHDLIGACPGVTHDQRDEPRPAGQGCDAGAFEDQTVDDDGDGWSPPDDCDDGDAAVHPAAVEDCGDGIDNDCDGDIDGSDADCTGDDDTGDDDVGDDDGGDDDVGDDDIGDDDGGDDDLGDDDLGDDDTAPNLTPGDVIFTEVMQNPATVDDEDGEWFELYNTTGADLDLGGCVLSDLGVDYHTIAGPLIAPTQGFVVFSVNGDPLTNGGLSADYVYPSDFYLSNWEDELVLDCGIEVDRIEWDVFGWPNPTGASMTLDPQLFDGLSNDDGGHWCEATTTYGLGDLGTPGSANDACSSPGDDDVGDDDVGDDDMADDDMGDDDVGDDDASDDDAGDDDAGDDDASDDDVGDDDVGDDDVGDDDVGDDDIGDDDIGDDDVGDDDVGDDDVGDDDTAPGIYAGDVIFTEVMQNPSAVDDEDGEWFEVFNITTGDLDLDGCVVSDAGVDSHTIAGPLVAPAEGYLVLGVNGDAGTNGGVAVDYAIPADLYLGNGDDELVLTCGLEIDRVEWDGGTAWPDPEGASMTLAPKQLDGTANDDGGHWCEASTAYGLGDLGTPGAANDDCSPPGDDDGGDDDGGDDDTADDDTGDDDAEDDDADDDDADDDGSDDDAEDDDVGDDDTDEPRDCECRVATAPGGDARPGLLAVLSGLGIALAIRRRG